MKRIRNGKVYYTRKRKKPEEPRPSTIEEQKKIAEDFADAAMHTVAADPPTFGEWLNKKAHEEEGGKVIHSANYILGKYHSYQSKSFAEMSKAIERFPPLPRERNQLIQDLARNVTLEDKKVFHYGYIPISWLLAGLTYNEATCVINIIESWETQKLMAYRKAKGFFEDLKEALG